MDSGEAELPSIVDMIAAELLEAFDVAPRIAGLRAPYRVLREDFHDEVGRVLERHLQLETLLALAVSADRLLTSADPTSDDIANARARLAEITARLRLATG